MKFSESLRKGIMEAGAGGILNKFKAKRRRSTLFFEDILANYIEMCENEGYEKEMEEIGELWGALSTEILLPTAVKKLPIILFSRIANKIWSNIGMVKNIEIVKTGNKIKLNSEMNAITRIIGKNSFVPGSYTGILKVYLKSDLIATKITQSLERDSYEYSIKKAIIDVKGKDKDEYNRLNVFPVMEGFSLSDALKKRIFKLNGNRLFFRGKSIFYSENTLFHIIGNRNIMLDKVSDISYKYFRSVLDKNSSREKKLLLLKTLLHIMGWGILKIKVQSENITIEISHLPAGLQLENENWEFLIRTITGYIKVIDKGYKLSKNNFNKNKLIISYTK